MNRPVYYPMKKGLRSGFNAGSLFDIGKGLVQHLALGNGQLAFPWVCGYAFGHSGIGGAAAEAGEGNDLQIHWLPFVPKDQRELEANMGRPKRADRPLSDLARLPDEGVTFLPSLVLPRSVGSVRLASADPRRAPARRRFRGAFSHIGGLRVGAAQTRTGTLSSYRSDLSAFV